MDIDRKIEEKKKKLLKTMIGEGEKDRDEGVVKSKIEGRVTRAAKKVRFGTVLPEVVDKMIEAIALAEDKQKSQVVEEAVREYFKERWEEYDETTKSFLLAKFGKEIVKSV